MISGFKVLTISHKYSPIEIREQFAMSTIECSQFLALLKDTFGISEALVVSTCNRTEIYFNNPEIESYSVYKLLCAFKAVESSNHLFEYFEKLEAVDAVQHLYYVAIGLESKVLGDIQIFGQVKQAYQLSNENEMAGPLIHRLMHSIFHTHKKISQETKFKTGAASISYNAVKLLSSNTFLSKEVKILIVGAGSIGTATAKNLMKCGYSDVSITNRTSSKSDDLAREFGIKVINFDTHKSQLHHYDVLFSCVGASEAIYKLSQLEEAGLTVAIDLSSPRSITGEKQQHEVRLFDIDEVGDMRDDTLSIRTSEVPQVKEIIAQGMLEFVEWSEEMYATGSIKKFKNALEKIQKDCIKANLKKMSSKELAMVEHVTAQFINKVVQKPIIKLKQECQRDSADQLSGVLLHLFDLKNETLKES